MLCLKSHVTLLWAFTTPNLAKCFRVPLLIIKHRNHRRTQPFRVSRKFEWIINFDGVNWTYVTLACFLTRFIWSQIFSLHGKPISPCIDTRKTDHFPTLLMLQASYWYLCTASLQIRYRLRFYNTAPRSPLYFAWTRLLRERNRS